MAYYAKLHKQEKHVPDELSGINRAIAAAGSQVALAAALSVRSGDKVLQSTISRWVSRGGVPGWHAADVSEITGVPIADLLKKTPRKKRSNGNRTS